MAMTSADGECQEIPEGDVAIRVKLINPVDFGPAQLDRFVEPAVPDLKFLDNVPSLCFLLEHPSGRNVVWDLGIRKDFGNYSATISAYISTTNYNIQTKRDVAEILLDGGYSLSSIEAVIWSHWHWDHIGDPSTFPTSTSLIVGPGFTDAFLPGAPNGPASPILESDYAGRDLCEVAFTGFKIAGLHACDYFEDGSFYILDTPGHAVGHLSALARVTTDPQTFVLLGGDVCHYPGVLRPSSLLPLPGEICPHPFRERHPSRPFCPSEAFANLQSVRGRHNQQTVYDPTFGHDIALAKSTVAKMQRLDCRDDVFVILAHDAHVRDLVDHFPHDLNEWKQRGWGKAARWLWLKDLETYWRLSGVID